MKTVVCCLLLLLLTLPLAAQTEPEPGHTGAPPEGVEDIAFIIGDWAFESTRNVQAFNLDDLRNAEPSLDSATGVMRIASHLDGHGYLGHYTTAMAGDRVEGTMFFGLTTSDWLPWDLIWVESGFDRIMTLNGEVNEDGALAVEDSVGLVDIYTTITSVDEDAFTLSILLDGSQLEDDFVMWQADFTRIEADEADTMTETLRTDFELAPEPEGIHQFDFFIGEFELVSLQRTRDFEPLPARNTIQWINGGHAFAEHWVALWDQSPFEAIAITMYDPSIGRFHNIWWQTGISRAGQFSSTGCEGEGEDYFCKIAGFFKDISDDGFLWTSNLDRDTSGWVMEFTRIN